MPLKNGSAPHKRQNPTPRPSAASNGTQFSKAGENAYVIQALFPLCVPIADVKLDPRNPRKNDAAAKKLAALIAEHGFRDPIIVDSEGTIRAGNTRYKAAKILGMTSIPATRQGFRSEVAATAFGISHNKASEFSDWDKESLLDLMGAEEFPPKMTEATGWTEDELKRIAAKLDAPEEFKDVSVQRIEHQCPKCGYEWRG